MSDPDRIESFLRDKNPEEIGDIIFEIEADQGLWEEKPVGIEQFVTDPEYLGGCFPEPFYPFWLDLLKRLYPTPFYSPYLEVIGHLPIGSGKCLAEHTRIPTTIGTLPMKELYERFQGGEYFRVLTEDGVRPVYNVVRNGKKPTKRIQTRAGRVIEGSRDHRLRVWTNTPTGPEIAWKRMEDIVPRDRLVGTRQTAALPDTQWPEDLGYFLGVLNVFGFVRYNESNRWRWVGMAYQKPKNDDERIFFDRVLRLFRRFVGRPRIKTKEGVIYLSTRNNRLGQALADHGLLDENGEYQVPRYVFEASPRDAAQWFAGLVDASGILEDAIVLRSPREGFLRDVATVLSSLGVLWTLRRDGEEWVLSVANDYNFYRLREHGFKLRVPYKQRGLEGAYNRDHIGISVPFTEAAAADILEKAKQVYRPLSPEGVKLFRAGWESGKGCRVNVLKLERIRESYPEALEGHPTLAGLADRKAFFDDVVAVRDGEAEVYDLSVEGSPNYVVDGIWSHNSITGVTILSYEIYRILCLTDPQRYYTLPDIPIVFAFLSATKGLAKDVNWQYFENYLDSSPWFLKNCPLPRKGRINKESNVVLPKNIYLHLGSEANQILGKAVFGGILDEANFQREKSQQAHNTYVQMRQRMESRFITAGLEINNIPGKVVLMSSPKDASDFLAKRIADLKKLEEENLAKGRPDTGRTMILDGIPIWTVRKGTSKDIYCGESFRIFVGDDSRDPFILDAAEEADASVDPEDPLVHEIPVEHRESFEGDLLWAIKNILGFSTASAQALIRSPSRFSRALVLPNRFRKEILRMSFTDEITLAEAADLEYFRKPSHPHCYRFVHVDIAFTQDRLGIAACYAIPDEDVLFEETGENGVRVERAPERIYVIEWILALEAVPGQEIPLHKVREFLLHLKRLGYPIYSVSSDHVAGRAFLQELELNGFTTEKISVDRTRDPYVAFKAVTYRGRMLLPNHKLFKHEILALRDDGRKIDHSRSGSKDAADGAAGAYWACSKSPIIVRPMSLFAQSVKPQNSLHAQIYEGMQRRALDSVAEQFGLKNQGIL